MSNNINAKTNQYSLAQKKIIFGQLSKSIKKFSQDQLFNNKLIKRSIKDYISISNPSLEQVTRSYFQKFVIKYENPYKSVWDIFILLLIAYNCITVAFYVCFDPIEELAIFDAIIEICFGCDIFLRFLHEYEDPETFEIVKDVKKISKKYLKSWFIIDLITIFPFHIIFQDGKSIKLIRLLRLPKFLRLIEFSKLDSIIQPMLIRSSSKQKLDYLFTLRYFYQFFQFIIFSFTITYFLGCLWYSVVASDFNDQENFAGTFYSQYNLSDYGNFRQMIMCSYFSMTILTTVGYGDLVPQTNTERILAIFIMILGIAFFSYIMGNFTDVITSYENQLGQGAQISNLQKWMTSLAQFNSKSLPQKLAQQIDEHFSYFWKHDRLCGLVENDEYLKQLPEAVQLHLIHYLFDDIFKLFSGFFQTQESHFQYPYQYPEKQFLFDIAFNIFPRKYDNGEYLIRQGQQIEEVLLVFDGEVKVSFMYEENIQISRIASRGFYFGDFHIFSNNKSQYDYRAKNTVKVFAISQQSLIHVLHKYPQVQNQMISYSYKFWKQKEKYMASILKERILRVKGIEMPQSGVIQQMKEKIINPNKNEKVELNFKDLFGNWEINFEKLESEMEEFQSAIDQLAHQINLIRTQVEDNVEEIGETIQTIQLTMLEQQNYN